MARQFHNVTAEQIAYVAQLQRSGDGAGALQAANEAATKGFDDQTRKLKENMGTLETWADRTAQGIQIHVGCGAGYWSPGLLCRYARHKLKEAFDEADKENGSGIRAEATGAVKRQHFLPISRGRMGEERECATWALQPPRCRQILKRPVRWQQTDRASLRRHG
ncbi:hypothetical protein LQT00_22705 [Escherichia coli]|nr:hypothetical protein LQT00_22705 [Escherichia coli]